MKLKVPEIIDVRIFSLKKFRKNHRAIHNLETEPPMLEILRNQLKIFSAFCHQKDQTISYSLVFSIRKSPKLGRILSLRIRLYSTPLGWPLDIYEFSFISFQSGKSAETNLSRISLRENPVCFEASAILGNSPPWTESPFFF